MGSAADLGPAMFVQGLRRTSSVTRADEEAARRIFETCNRRDMCLGLKDTHFDVHDLKHCGFDAADLKFAGFSASELKSGGFDDSLRGRALEYNLLVTCDTFICFTALDPPVSKQTHVSAFIINRNEQPRFQPYDTFALSHSWVGFHVKFLIQNVRPQQVAATRNFFVIY